MMCRSKYISLVVLVLCWPALSWGQQEMRSATKGSSTPLPITGTVIDANHNGLDVNIVGGSGSGGTQYAEDSAHVSGDSVNMAGVVQQSADAALSSDGDRSVLQVDGNGYLKVNIKAGAGSGGTAMTDDAAFTPATTSITPAGFMFDDVAPDSVNEGDGGVGRMSANRNQYMQIRDNAGNERGLNVDANGEIGIGAIRSALPAGTNAIGKLSANSGVDIGDVDVTSVTPGTTAASLGKAEDAAHASGDTGVMLLGVRNDSLATTLTNTDGDYSPFALDNLGRLFITQTSIIPGTNATHLGKAEDAAHTTGDVGVMTLCVRSATLADKSAGATDGDYEPCQVNAAGAVYTAADTEMPAAATLADATSNPTVPGVASFNMCYNGTTWDRCVKAVDPCQVKTKVHANINGTAGATLVTGTASKKIYLCSINIVTATAQNINLVSGTGTVCATSTAATLGLTGGTTAGTGWNFAANGGLTLGSGGFSIGQTNVNADNLCMLISGSGQVTGGFSYVVQ